MNTSAKTNLSQIVTQEILQEVINAIESLRFGSVEITVHDGKVTQIERCEKVRFGQDAATKKPTGKSLL